MSRLSFALAPAFAALSLCCPARAQSLPAQARSPSALAPPSSFTLAPTGALSLSDIASLTANCPISGGPSPIIRCHPDQVKVYEPAPPASAELPFRLNPGRWSSKDWQDGGRNVAATSFSLHVAGNVATKDSTRIFLKGLGGDALAAKAPEIFEMIKSPAARYVALAGVVIGGTVYLYEGLWGGSSATDRPQRPPQGATFRMLPAVSSPSQGASGQ